VCCNQCTLSELVSADVSAHVRVEINILAAEHIIHYEHNRGFFNLQNYAQKTSKRAYVLKIYRKCVEYMLLKSVVH
jgi:hypothetical protein